MAKQTKRTAPGQYKTEAVLLCQFSDHSDFFLSRSITVITTAATPKTASAMYVLPSPVAAGAAEEAETEAVAAEAVVVVVEDFTVLSVDAV